MLSIPAPWSERLGIVSRALAAIVGGYALKASKLSTFWRENVADAEDEREFLRRQD